MLVCDKVYQSPVLLSLSASSSNPCLTRLRALYSEDPAEEKLMRLLVEDFLSSSSPNPPSARFSCAWPPFSGPPFSSSPLLHPPRTRTSMFHAFVRANAAVKPRLLRGLDKSAFLQGLEVPPRPLLHGENSPLRSLDPHSLPRDEVHGDRLVRLYLVARNVQLRAGTRFLRVEVARVSPRPAEHVKLLVASNLFLGSERRLDPLEPCICVGIAPRNHHGWKRLRLRRAAD